MFDVVNTLIGVRGSVGEIYAAIAARHGIVVDPIEIDRRFPTAFRSAPLEVEHGLRVEVARQRERERWRQIVQGTADAFSASPAFDAFFTEVFEAFRRTVHWRVLPEAQVVLAELAVSGYTLSVLSDMDARLHDILEGFDLRRYFAKVLLPFDLGSTKPELRFFRAALQNLGADAAAAVYVGDDPRKDAAPALAVGMQAILVGRRFLHAPPAGAHVVDNLQDLPGVLKALDRRR